MERTPGRAARSCGALLLTLAVLAVPGPVATAEPATPVAFPTGSSATRASGLGFDTCTAPSVAALRAWRASPFRTVNTYFGGINRACAQPELTAAWVSTVTREGWRLLPTYLGWQPSCILGTKRFRYTATDAAARGDADGRDALAQAAALGLRPGSALYADVEHYDPANASCTGAVRTYVSAWTRRLHAAGYLAGVYVAQGSGALHLSQSYGSTAHARPDAVWMARWDGMPTLTGWATVPASQWAVHQRIKQYRGDHVETWGGVSINIDSDVLDAPLATVAYRYAVSSSAPTAARTGPSTAAAVVREHAPAAPLDLLCQTTGSVAGTAPLAGLLWKNSATRRPSTTVWDRLVDGTWVSDRDVSTPSRTGFSAPLPRCTYPGQVTAADGLVARSAPSSTAGAVGAPLPAGALAYVVCQRTGSPVGTTAVWDQLDDGRWVSDLHVSNASDTTFSPSVPRC